MLREYIIRRVSPMGEKDTVTKTLESYESVFADIVNVLLFDGESVISAEDLSPRKSIFKNHQQRNGYFNAYYNQ